MCNHQLFPLGLPQSVSLEDDGRPGRTARSNFYTDEDIRAKVNAWE